MNWTYLANAQLRDVNYILPVHKCDLDIPFNLNFSWNLTRFRIERELNLGLPGLLRKIL